jgi:hypothetical protein
MCVQPEKSLAEKPLEGDPSASVPSAESSVCISEQTEQTELCFQYRRGAKY